MSFCNSVSCIYLHYFNMLHKNTLNSKFSFVVASNLLKDELLNWLLHPCCELRTLFEQIV